MVSFTVEIGGDAFRCIGGWERRGQFGPFPGDYIYILWEKFYYTHAGGKQSGSKELKRNGSCRARKYLRPSALDDYSTTLPLDDYHDCLPAIRS